MGQYIKGRRICASRAEVKRIRARLREVQRSEGLRPKDKPTVANHLSHYERVEQEQEARSQAVVDKVAQIRAQLPGLLRRLARIPDPRNPKKITHKLTVLMIYGILAFVLQPASRREVNREMSRPAFKDNLMLLFPELETIPHCDTLTRLLDRIDVEYLQEAQLELIGSLIRKKKFRKFLIAGHYPIAIDGTQKFAGSLLWDEHYLQRQVGDEKSRRPQYYVSVLEANLVLTNGMSIPLLSEFLDFEQGDNGRDKQDCELRAFYRLTERLRRAFPRLPIMLLLDGLYPVGPVMNRCAEYRWEFMIVLQDGSLPSVWEEYQGLVKLLEPEERHRMSFNGRDQRFHWVNGIEYIYDHGGTKRTLTVHIVVCEETWQEVDPQTAQILTKHSRHVWLSNRPLNKENVHGRCNLGARHRWAIESSILVEKHHGYNYQHCFAFSWSALKGYHYLMRIAHLLNVLVLHSHRLRELVAELGARGTIRFIRDTIAGPWLDHQQVRAELSRPHQLRLSHR